MELTREPVRCHERSTSLLFEPNSIQHDCATGPILGLQNVLKSYDARVVLTIGCLEILRGETLAIIGPSGSGKTTLLKLLALVEQPDTGIVRFSGQATSGLETPVEIRRRVVMVFQRPRLLCRSVETNVGYGLRLRRTHYDRSLLKNLLVDLGLQGLGRRLATSLSGGEQQRVALARALAVQPDALLLDEPTAQLDPANVVRIEDQLRSLTERRKTTVVLATHNLFQARRLADRVLLLLDGHVVEIADVNRFFDAPIDARAAAFLRGELVY